MFRCGAAARFSYRPREPRWRLAAPRHGGGSFGSPVRISPRNHGVSATGSAVLELQTGEKSRPTLWKDEIGAKPVKTYAKGRDFAPRDKHRRLGGYKSCTTGHSTL